MNWELLTFKKTKPEFIGSTNFNGATFLSDYRRKSLNTTNRFK
jgi:hypothetical protein